MSEIRVIWNAAKDLVNRHKHGVSFEEAASVFLDVNARLVHDPDHSDNEDRYVLLGLSRRMRLLIVCHAYRSDDTEIRIISARKANKSEQSQYPG